MKNTYTPAIVPGYRTIGNGNVLPESCKMKSYEIILGHGENKERDVIKANSMEDAVSIARDRADGRSLCVNSDQDGHFVFQPY